MFLQSQYLQTGLGHSALEAGELILPVTAPMIVISRSPAASSRWWERAR